MGNRLLTLLSNAFTNLNLTDMETCYKLFRTDIIKSLDLKEKRFGFEPEVTAKVARVPHVRIYEVGISYYGRTFEEGKKINWRDGVKAVYCILKYNLQKRVARTKDRQSFPRPIVSHRACSVSLRTSPILFRPQRPAPEHSSIPPLLVVQRALSGSSYMTLRLREPALPDLQDRQTDRVRRTMAARRMMFAGSENRSRLRGLTAAILPIARIRNAMA